MAYIELGGLHMSLTITHLTAGIVGENDSLGGAKINRIAYNFTAGSVTGQISLDHDGAGNSHLTYLQTSAVHSVLLTFAHLLPI